MLINVRLKYLKVCHKVCTTHDFSTVCLNFIYSFPYIGRKRHTCWTADEYLERPESFFEYYFAITISKSSLFGFKGEIFHYIFPTYFSFYSHKFISYSNQFDSLCILRIVNFYQLKACTEFIFIKSFNGWVFNMWTFNF